MANEDAEPPRLVRPYVTPSPAGPDGPVRPAEQDGPPPAGAHRGPGRPSHWPAALHWPPPAKAAPGSAPGATDGPRQDGGPGRRWRALGIAAVAAVVALTAGLLVVLDRRDRSAGTSTSTSTGLATGTGTGADADADAVATPPVSPPGTGSPSPSVTAVPSRTPSRSAAPRRSATAGASGAGTPAAANPDGRNLALGRPATSSSVEGDNLAPRFAVDGDPGTRWSSAFSDPQWIGVDLGQVWLVTQVVLRWEVAYGVDYDLAVSTDGTTWRTVWRTTDGAGGVRDVRIVATPARFVRMNGTRRSGMYGYSLWELEIR